MRSTFFGLELGRRALQSQQRALDVTGHNIANANTKGYTRQEAVLTATDPYTVPAFNTPVAAGQLGTGVQVEQIRRIQDAFIKNQIRTENKITGEWEARQDALEKLEVIFNEPSDSSLSTVMDEFWEALQILSQKPEESSARTVVIERGITLADTFNHIYDTLNDYKTDLDQFIDYEIQGINSIAEQIAGLNKQIVTLETAGQQANDLRDKRDLLIDELSKLADINVTETSNGSVAIDIGGHDLVNYDTFDKMVSGSPVKWDSDGITDVTLNSGKLCGMLYARDNIVQEYMLQLDLLAQNFITEFNTVHKNGFGLDSVKDRNFFRGTDAKSMAVDISDPDHVAASLTDTGVPGDNGNALDLAALKQKNIDALSGTIDSFYTGLMAQLGIDAQQANRMVENQQLLLEHLEVRKQEVSGVSLDEEMTNMIRFQHAYNAAARITTAMDELLDIIVNKMGLTGR